MNDTGGPHNYTIIRLCILVEFVVIIRLRFIHLLLVLIKNLSISLERISKQEEEEILVFM